MSSSSSDIGARLRAWASRVPIDAIALLVIGLAIFVTHRPFVRHGMCFNDPSWYFHFGQRTLDGAVPYRDYIFQVGPLPIYVDAGFQSVFGAQYTSSLYAGMFIKVLRVFAVWMIARRLAGWRAAALLGVFCSFDPIFAFVHHWSTPYAELFLTLAGLCFLLATRAAGRRELVYLGLAGFCIALVMSARQSGVLVSAPLTFVATAILLARKEYFTRKRFLALWSGFAAGVLLLFAALALVGALGPAIQQMFLDAPQKKGIHGLDAILDAVSGGAMSGGGYSWWRGFLFYLALPGCIVAGAVYFSSRERAISTRSLVLLLVPIALVLGLLERDASLDLTVDLPRVFLTVVSAVAVLAPARARQWFGVEPLVALGLGALSLMADWALEMSFPGRGWVDGPALVTGAILISLASTRITQQLKTLLCIPLAVVAVVHVFHEKARDINPFAYEHCGNGKLRENRYPSSNPVMRDLRVAEARTKIVDWLTSQVTPGSTCFVYGNVPVLYDLLRCTNPTRVDTTVADFITDADAEEAIAVMRADPPDYIVAQDTMWMNPALSLDLGDDVARYDGLNPKSSRAMHVGLRSILDRYEHVGLAADIIGPELAKHAGAQWDVMGATHLYRRKR